MRITCCGGQSTTNNMTNKNKKMLLALPLLTLALAAGVVLLQNNQDTRKGAYFTTTRLFLQTASTSYTAGAVAPVQVWVDSPQKMNFVETVVCWEAGKLSLPTTATDLLASVRAKAPFTDVLKAKLLNDNCLQLAVKAEVADTAISAGPMPVATIDFTAGANGTVQMGLSKELSTVSGFNTTSTDTAAEIATPELITLNIGGSGTGPQLAFFVTLSNLTKENYDRCENARGSNIKVDLQVQSGSGVMTTFNQVALTRDSEWTIPGTSVNLVKYKGVVTLAGVVPGSNFSLFIKGPKHIQTKYGVNNQTTYYNEPKGNLTLTAGTNEFSFMAYPLLAGDITGPSGSADNKVDGLDYAMVKAEFAKDSNRDLKADLDYSCDISGNDINLVKVALNERQSQRY